MNGVLGFEQITDLSTAKSLTIPPGTQQAWLQAESDNVRYRIDGQDPTASVGMLIKAADDRPTKISAHAGLKRIRVIAASGTPKLNVTYFG